MRGLTLAQRLTYFASIIHWAGGVPRLLIYLTPVLLLLTGIAPVQQYTWTLGAIFLAYIGTMLLTLRVVYRNYMNYSLTEYFNMANFWTQIRATTRALIYRKRSKFVVTNKAGGDIVSEIDNSETFEAEKAEEAIAAQRCRIKSLWEMHMEATSDH